MELLTGHLDSHPNGSIRGGQRHREARHSMTPPKPLERLVRGDTEGGCDGLASDGGLCSLRDVMT